MIQLIIVLSGAITIAFLSTKQIQIRRWGFIIGLLFQPFWLYANYTAQQWGMFILSIWYLICFIEGIHTHFIKKNHDDFDL